MGLTICDSKLYLNVCMDYGIKNKQSENYVQDL